MRALEANAAFVGRNAAFEEHWKKTGFPFVTVAPGDEWPATFALYVWLDQARPPIEKLNRLLTFGQTLIVPESKFRDFKPFKGSLQKFPDRWLVDVAASEPSCVKSFVFGSFRPKEEMSAEPRRPIRQALSKQVFDIYASQSLAVKKLSFYPEGFKTVFSFRVDADEFEAPAFDRFFESAQKYSHAISIFFSMANYENRMDQIKRCVDAGFDVHSHAYTHYTYKSYAQNKFNLKKAETLLSQAGSAGKGFASPYGRWNPNLQRVMEEIGYEFSSEFSYNYDDFPSYPVIHGKRSSVLQVPVHPIGLGVYMESSGRYDQNEVYAYYENLFKQLYDNGEPILFYDHPTQWLGVYPELMDFLFGLAQSRSDIWICSMTDWAKWWKRLDHEAVLHDIVPGSLPAQPPAYDEGKITHEKNIYRFAKRKVKRWLDWETSTPRKELVRDSLPSHIKFVLRSILRLS